MISNDKGEYLRVDVFDAKMEAFLSQIKLENEKLRNDLNSKIDNVQSILHSEIQGVKNDLNNKIDNVKNDLHSEIQDVKSDLNTKFEVLTTRMDGLEARITDMQYSVSWQFNIVAILVAVIGVIIGASVSFAPSIWAFIKRIGKPALSRNDVEVIVSEQVSQALDKYFQHKADIQGK